MTDEQVILEVLKKLDQRSRNILGLYFYENLDVLQISELMHLNSDLVINEIIRIKQLMLVSMKEEINQEDELTNGRQVLISDSGI